jgi:hypothetical protein
MYQLVAPGKLMVSPNLSFAPTLTLDELGNLKDLREITAEIIKRAKEQFDFHRDNLLQPSRGNPA